LRRALLAVLSLIALLAMSVVTMGCGTDDLSPEAVAEAAEKTRDEGTAKVAFAIRATGLGLPQEMTLRGKGITALDEFTMDVTMDLAPALTQAGIQADGQARLIVLARDLYVQVPKVEGFALPGGKTWIAADVTKVLEALGLDTEAIGALFTPTPNTWLRALTEAGRLERVGEEKIGGAETTHYRGALRLEDSIAALPADRRADAKRGADALLAQAGEKDVATPTEIWVDGDDRIRRMSQRTKVPARDGVPAGEVTMTFDYSDFGAELSIGAPPRDETFDATQALSDAAEQGAAVQP
jgi:hypothetical protein